MKIYPFIFVLVFCVVGCENAIKNEIKPDLIASNEIVKKTLGNNNTIVNSKEDLIGFWKGNLFKIDKKEKVIVDEDFAAVRSIYSKPKFKRGTNAQLMFIISSIDNNQVEGDVFLYGEMRKAKGTFKQENGMFKIEMIEKSKSKDAVKFQLDIQLGSNLLNVNWERVNKDENDRSYSTVLEKKVFKYNSEVSLEYRFINWEKNGKVKGTYEFQDSLGNTIKHDYVNVGSFTTTDTIFSINPSKDILSNELAENLSRGDLLILKNLVYAKHGLVFKDKMLSKYFNNHPWYLPMFETVSKDLTDIEKKNIDLLERYERNAKEYYQVFGR